MYTRKYTHGNLANEELNCCFENNQIHIKFFKSNLMIAFTNI